MGAIKGLLRSQEKYFAHEKASGTSGKIFTVASRFLDLKEDILSSRRASQTSRKIFEFQEGF